MFRRILAMLRRDLRSQSRDMMIAYMLAAPFILALVLRAFIPAVGGSSINIVVPESIGAAMITSLREYADVEVVRDRAAVEARVLQFDDAAGIVPDGSSYIVIREGNEGEATVEMPSLILADIVGSVKVPVQEVDLGKTESPFKPFAVSFVPLMGVMVGGLLIGFAIVDEKETNVVSALGITPLSRFEYIFGRSLVGVIGGLVLAIPPLYVLGVGSFDVPKVAVTVLGAILIATILGLYVGAVAGNQIEAIGVLKLAAIPFTIAPLLVFLLPDRWQWTLYWIPTYWTVRGLRAAVTGSGGWPEVVRLAGIGLAVSMVFLAISWRFLQRRLTVRGELKMMAFGFSDIPWWGWLLLVVAAAIVGPIKVRILKSMLNANKEKPAEEE